MTTNTSSSVETHQSVELDGFSIEIIEKDYRFHVVLKGKNGFCTTLKTYDYLIGATRFVSLVLSF